MDDRCPVQPGDVVYASGCPVEHMDAGTVERCVWGRIGSGRDQWIAHVFWPFRVRYGWRPHTTRVRADGLVVLKRTAPAEEA